MNKKLAAKIQKLVPMLGETEVIFSTSIAIEPPERELVLKKGSVYTAFDIHSPVELNVSLVTKVINDVLYDSYYQSENISPIQSLEKAVVNINDKISTLAAEKASTKPATKKDSGKITFNTVACVLWGNVLYIVQYGKGKSFLMREGDVKEVSSTTEGNFSVASGVVKNGDVIVLCTESFAKKYPPDKLLDSALSSKDLDPDSSCIILKFMVDEEFTEDEVIDFGVKPDKKSSKLPGILKGLKGKSDSSKQKDQPIETLVDEPKQKTPAAVSPAPASPVPPKTQAKKDEPNIKLRSKRGGRVKINTKSLLIAASVLLVISVVSTLIIRNNRAPDEVSSQEGGDGESSLFVPREFSKEEGEDQPQPEAEQDTQQEEPTPEEKQAEEDSLNKVIRVEAQPFYDIKLADEQAKPTQMEIFTNNVVVTDPNSGKIFTSDPDTPKFTAQEQAFSGITNLTNYNGRLNFSDDEGYKSYSLNDGSVAESYSGEFGVASRYLGNIYSLEGNEIVKYVPEKDTLNSSTWTTNDVLTNGKALGIAYSIYVVSENNQILVFTQGEQDSFEITGLDVPLNNVTDLAVNNNFDYIYVADSGQERVVVLDTEGALVKQIKTQEEGAWSDIRNIAVNEAETKLFVLSGSKVFEVDLLE